VVPEHNVLVTDILYIIMLARWLISKLFYSLDHRFPQTRLLHQSYIQYFTHHLSILFILHSKFSNLVCRIVYLELNLMVLLWQAEKTVPTTVTRKQYTKCYQCEYHNSVLLRKLLVQAFTSHNLSFPSWQIHKTKQSFLCALAW